MSKQDKVEPRVYVAGHRGMVGAAIVRRLEAAGVSDILARSHRELDLAETRAVDTFFAETRPSRVYLAAAKVGGIQANNSFPAEFIHQNLMIEANIIHAAWRNGVERLLFLGSSCIYPRLAPQPITEEALLSGPLESTNEPYAIAKIAGIKLCQAYRRQHGRDFISAMPCNLYGPGDNFDLANSHVLPALIRKAHEAKLRGESDLAIWGTGTPLREFLHVDDLADALVFLMKTYSDEPQVNVGSGYDVTIADLARMVMRVVGLGGELLTDPSKPDGTPRKLMDSSRLAAMGWTASIGLEDGIRGVYQGYLAGDAVRGL